MFVELKPFGRLSNAVDFPTGNPGRWDNLAFLITREEVYVIFIDWIEELRIFRLFTGLREGRA